MSEIEERKRVYEKRPAPYSNDAVAETRFGEISVIQYRLFTSNYGWLMIGPGVVLSTRYWLLAILLGVAAYFQFTKSPVALWLRHETNWFPRYYLGWTTAWIILGISLHPSTEHGGLFFLFMLITFAHGLFVIPKWRELERKLFWQNEAKGQSE